MLLYFKWFWQFWKQAKKKMILVLFVTMLTIVAKTAFPVFLKYIVDRLGGDYIVDQMHEVILIYLGAAVLHELLAVSLPNFRAYLNILYTVMIRNKYYNSFTKKNEHFFKKFRTGDLLTRLTDDIDGAWDRISWYSCSGVLRPVEAVLVLGFTLGVMFYYSVPLTLYTFIPLPFLVIILSKTEDKMVRYTIAKQKSISDCNNVLEACFSGIRVIKTTQSEDDQIRKYNEVLEERVKREKEFLKINQVIQFFSMLVNNAGIIIVMFIGSVYVVREGITLGTLLLFIIYLQQLVNPIWTISWFYASSKQVFRYVDRLIETETGDDHDMSKNRTKRVDEFNGISVVNVDFKFDDSENNVLNNISFNLLRGESLAVVGALGSGKSTLLEIIAGNLRPLSGNVTINGIPIDEIENDSLGNIIGYIKQENVLFSETIRKNLELGDEFSEEEIQQNLKTAIMTDEIDKFPKKMETVLGKRGLSLSGGQKQRLSIARTIIRKPKLLLMDDCTAAMDAHTEKIFWSSFRDNLPDTSCIIVTHRLATALHADKVIVLSDNKMVEYDTVENLSKDGTLFMKIMKGDLDHDIKDEVSGK
ncbi:MAG: ABC transporter ATP-binding protein [Candidatus Delongbacteria bacterium]|nr:ABC transporter ATP-binding protein [Candidatus Delongbacteria bacterium]